MAEKEEKPREKRLRRFRIGWYAIPGVVLVAFTAWLLINMASESGGALGSVLLGIVLMLGISELLFKALDRPTHVD
jgi:drug/metabolite transporter (DMT)-like permease